MDWQIGPIEGLNGRELQAAAKAAFQETYGAESGDTGEQLREQFDGLVSCLDHQVSAFEQGAGISVILTGSVGGTDASAAPQCRLEVLQLFREPSSRFGRDEQTSREHAGTMGRGS